jgi:hypothetical protein
MQITAQTRLCVQTSYIRPMTIYSENMYLVCTHIKLCLNCDIAYFLSPYIHRYE